MKALKVVSSVLAVLVFGYFCVVIGYNIKSDAKAQDKPPTVTELLTLVNQERAKAGVAPLTIDPRLNASAQMKANDEVQNGYFEHTCSYCLDGIKTAQEVLGKQGNYSENLYTSGDVTGTAKEAVRGWMNSAPHREAMLDPRYTLTGFGVNTNQISQHLYSAQTFTTPTTTN